MSKPVLKNTCNYLSWLYLREKLTGGQIIKRTVEMQEWLADNVGNIDLHNVWHNNYSWHGNMATIDGYRFHDRIWFAYEVDLLAFRLRWGIQL